VLICSELETAIPGLVCLVCSQVLLKDGGICFLEQHLIQGIKAEFVVGKAVFKSAIQQINGDEQDTLQCYS